MSNKKKYRNYGFSLCGTNLLKKINIIDFYQLEKTYGKLINKLNKNINILEYGPGNSILTQYLLIKGFYNIDLVEVSSDFYDSQIKAFKNINTINIYNEDINIFIDKSKKKYDLVISKQVIEHFNTDSISNFFNKSYDILNNKGFILLETINAYNIPYGIYYRYIDFSHTISFTSKSMNEFIVSSGKKYKINYFEVLKANTIIKIYLIIKKYFFGFSPKILKNVDIKIEDNIKKEKKIKIFLISIFKDFTNIISKSLTWFFFFPKIKTDFGINDKVIKTEFILFKITKENE